jgi:endoglucanase
MEKTDRRSFLRQTAMTAAAVSLTGSSILASPFSASRSAGNVLPRWRGFNLLDYFSPNASDDPESRTTEDDFRWMRDWGFDFVRIPMAYPRYVTFERGKPITPEQTVQFRPEVADKVQQLVETANRYGLHVSLNLHRAPGYCVNAGFNEPFNLWKDAAAQQAFYAHWDMWAKRFKHVPASKLSFDLLNEPAFREDMNDQFSAHGPVPGDLYRKVALETAKVIHEVTPDRMIVADGNNMGGEAIPELVGTGIHQSCRAYFPHYVSHYQASWVWKDPSKAPMPVWPGMIDGQYFGREQLEAFYKPWIGLVEQGVGVHCGEGGCYNKTPHPVFLAWFGDIVDILRQHGIGYALWNFRGDFGILDSGRSDVAYEDWYGHKLDRKLLEVLK